MTTSPNPYHGFRFPAEIIEHAVWLYHCFSLSLRDVETILAARGIVVSYESIRDWSLRFGRLFANTLKRRRPRPGDKWFMDEVFHPHPRQAALSLACGRSGRARARHPGAEPAQCQSGQALLSQAAEGLAVLPRVIVTDKLRATRLRNVKSCPASSIARAAISTTAPRCHTSRHGDENGRCSGSSQPSRATFSLHPQPDPQSLPASPSPPHR